MRIEKVPPSNAPLVQKRNWLIYQLVRYRNWHKKALLAKFTLDLAVCISLAIAFGIYGLVIFIPYGFISERVYDRVTGKMLLPYYKDITEYIYDGTSDPYDLVLLLNRVENYINCLTPQRTKLYEDMVACVTDINKRREPNVDTQEGEVQKAT